MNLAQELLRFLIVSSALSTAAVFIIRHLVDRFFARDLEKFKSELEKDVLRDHIRYEKLHTERATVIKKVYRDIVNVYRDFSSLMNPLQMAGEPTKEEKTKKAAESANTFLNDFEENRIFFEEELAERLDTLQTSLRKIWLDFQYKDDLPLGKERLAEWSKAWTAIQEEIPQLKKIIESDFRNILGLTEKQKTKSS